MAKGSSGMEVILSSLEVKLPYKEKTHTVQHEREENLPVNSNRYCPKSAIIIIVVLIDNSYIIVYDIFFAVDDTVVATLFCLTSQNTRDLQTTLNILGILNELLTVGKFTTRESQKLPALRL